MSTPTLLVIKTAAPADRRWSLELQVDAWPHKRHLRGMPTKRSAYAIKSISDLRTGDGSAGLALTMINDYTNNWTRKGFAYAVARKEALSAFVSLMSALSVAPPVWWPAFAAHESKLLSRCNP